jgi:ElaB/YqjD/DUF883 family membrane-anchored ribosome-binding protein
MDDRLNELRADLERIVERIDELAFEVLRDAAARGDATRPELDRRLVRTRRAIERAINMLSSP